MSKPLKSIRIGDYIEQIESDPKWKKALERGRAWVLAHFYEDADECEWWCPDHAERIDFDDPEHLKCPIEPL